MCVSIALFLIPATVQYCSTILETRRFSNQHNMYYTSIPILQLVQLIESTAGADASVEVSKLHNKQPIILIKM